ncbi:Sensor histidine kinase YehU [Marinomonas spartinae]|uniref:histidine kinase n=1 Tax=Marinomonas spartinae TaxID=1792290 RepID=A0A1A8TBT9_9GAMM|nr:sensor histidine kinase [Marinomonas spartinae]SBS29283.1 Sensor histidine kinase YehU [Marinomonas spartinae]
MHLVPSLLQQMCVYLVLAYMLSKTPIFLPLLNISSQRSHKFSCYVLFSLFCILGTYFGLNINDAIANTRAIGAVIGGLLGGPVVGFAVGLTGGIHRYTLGGFTDVACAISTTTEGLIGGLLHLYLVRKDKSYLLFNPLIVLAITFVAEVSQMLIILAVAKPFDRAYSLVSEIAAPMIIANCVGAALFVSILQDKKTIFERYSAVFSRRALTIAERSVGIWSTGFDGSSAEKVARIIYEETNVGAVAITDTENTLAFIGIGEDHHKPNTPISSKYTRQAMEQNRIIYLGARESPYHCSISDTCKLGTVLVIPLRAGKKVVGTIKLYEPKRKLLSNINRSMGEGIGQLLSSQILYGDFQQQQALLTQAEIKLLHAQVNPHFLFNALNTISAVIRRDPNKARELIQHLSHFFRSNLKQNIETVALKDELAHVNAYLTIEKARFTDRLTVEVNIHEAIQDRLLPSFTLQPLVENAIKHGISTMLEGGRVRIYSERNGVGYNIVVEDNAGQFVPASDGNQGLGMEIVAKRLVHFFGDKAALQTECEAGKATRMRFLVPDQVSS